MSAGPDFPDVEPLPAGPDREDTSWLADGVLAAPWWRVL
jgi:hypothetical protein